MHKVKTALILRYVIFMEKPMTEILNTVYQEQSLKGEHVSGISFMELQSKPTTLFFSILSEGQLAN